jgi:tRNA(Ile)-lysidine synthase
MDSIWVWFMDGQIKKADRRLWQTVLQTIRPFSLTASHTKLLIGVSGGIDSLSLLHLLWRQLGPVQLVVAHLNHGLRPEADGDAQFVVETAVSWQISYVTEKINAAEVAETQRLSLEAAARLVRYQFLARQAALVGATAVVTAHHADDQAETVLLHLLRGSGSAGLRGMLPVGVVPESEGMPLLRPFLTTPRAELEAYCARHALQPRHDSSNEDVQFTRNRIRHELLPLLQTYNPQVSAHLQQMAIITADEYAALLSLFDQVWPDILVAQGKDWLVLERQRLVAQPVAWQRLALRRAVQQLSSLTTEISFQTIELARLLILENQSGAEASLPGGLIMQVAAHEVTFGDVGLRRPAAVPQLDFEGAVRLPVPGHINLGNGWTVTAVPRTDLALDEIWRNDNPWRAFVALAGDEALWLRPSLPGERFQPLGLGGRSQAIQDLLADRKVGRGQRPLWPVVATEKHPAWIVGQHLDNRVGVTVQTGTVVQLMCKQSSGL